MSDIGRGWAGVMAPRGLFCIFSFLGWPVAGQFLAFLIRAPSASASVLSQPFKITQCWHTDPLSHRYRLCLLSLSPLLFPLPQRVRKWRCANTGTARSNLKGQLCAGLQAMAPGYSVNRACSPC